MKYYTAFLYKDKSPGELHCTHRYFGKLSDEEVADVTKIIDRYSTDLIWKVPIIAFSVPDMFGNRYKTRALRAESSSSAKLALFPELRSALTRIGMPDVYSLYQPHVTCDLEKIEEPFDRYALIGSGGVIVKEWKL